MKWLALLLMVLDHIGYFFADRMPTELYLLLRIAGRLAFPLFAVSVAIGYVRTSNRFRYFLRMVLFAVITQLLFLLAGRITGTTYFINVLFTFALAVACLYFLDLAEASVRILRGKPKENQRTEDQNGSTDRKINIRVHPLLALGVSFAGILSAASLSLIFEPDYGLFGVLSVVFFYYVYKFDGIPIRREEIGSRTPKQNLRWIICFFLYLLIQLIWMLIRITALREDPVWSAIQIFSAFSIFLIPFGHGRTRPKWPEKYFFYAFYPTHLFLFMLIRYFLF